MRIYNRAFSGEEILALAKGDPIIANFLSGKGKFQLHSWKGDYLHRPDSAQGVTTWSTGVGNEWIVERVVSGEGK